MFVCVIDEFQQTLSIGDSGVEQIVLVNFWKAILVFGDGQEIASFEFTTLRRLRCDQVVTVINELYGYYRNIRK